MITKKEGILIHPRSVLRMRVEKGEFCLSDVDFEAKSQTSPSFAQWAIALMAKKKYVDNIVSAGIGKAMNLSKNLFINRSPMDLEFFISRWSIETHVCDFMGGILPYLRGCCGSDWATSVRRGEDNHDAWKLWGRLE